jgi:hypothetical protein
MENKFELLRQGLEKMEIVTVSAAYDLTGLSKTEIINFVKSDQHLRIFDDEHSCWINENVDGHC